MKKIFYIQKYAFWRQTDKENMPNVDFIPALLRRRLTGVEKIGLYLANQLEPFPPATQVVFASRFGEWQQTIDLIRQFFNDHEMSPAGFSHSVHNAMPGVFSLLGKNKESYTSIAAGENTIESGLMDAFCGKLPTLFICAEEETPEFYRPQFSNPFGGHGVAFILSDQPFLNARKISLEITKSSETSLTFEKLCRFLDTEDGLITEHFVLRKEK
ncbi:MAG: beta-ketoacyl synthase chain length factor [Alphaproteobacteria bacterium]|nr:beta-ketoacyl synthase chain length factor [Alphaproteobacteria bacterium]